MDFTALSTKRFLLRQIEPQDIDILYHYWSDPEVTRYLSVCYSERDEARAMIEVLNSMPKEDSGMRWAIVDKSGQVLGTCGFHRASLEHRRTEVGYEIGTAYWGQGVVQESLTAILNLCFITLGFNRVEALVACDNKRSLTTLKRLGFKVEGLLRNYEMVKGEYQDQYVLSMLHSEWLPSDISVRAESGFI